MTGDLQLVKDMVWGNIVGETPSIYMLDKWKMFSNLWFMSPSTYSCPFKKTFHPLARKRKYCKCHAVSANPWDMWKSHLNYILNIFTPNPGN
jgi:hypothetical protein